MLHRRSYRGSSGPPSAHVYICLSGNVLRAYKKLASRTTSRLLAAGDSLHHEMRFHTLLGDLSRVERSMFLVFQAPQVSIWLWEGARKRVLDTPDSTPSKGLGQSH
ncbi:uncharacterized protein LOC8079838 isoform X4 [Sorghum bicolor]|uniref:uncharacterized protein LOC8079838 isoform X4 n=1 Tax=Sorghum bicolor TaxID=4558 RepID=UPI000B42537F|nr:uncharacterized protein LOC8079838 isoform X4 [Sorghum bicolor]|eukprot:XP_021302296.1 uncharacterized protein LOC8079838 isoform X4 [Sorghum bicolor]